MLLVATLLLASCARDLQIDLPDEPARIVVVSHFTTGEPFQANVTLSQPVYAVDDEGTPASVDITVSNGGQFYTRLLRKLDDRGKIFFESSAVVRPETPYTITVEIGGYPRVQATSSVPPFNGLESFRVLDSIRIENLADGKKALRIPLELKLPNLLPVTGRYYAFNLRHEKYVYEIINGQKVFDYPEEADTYFVTDGPTLSLLNNIAEPVVLVNENFWNDNRRKLYLDAIIPFNPATDEVKRIFLEWRTLSEDFYRYHLSLARQGTNQPLSDPDAVFNNVINGYGNFSGYSVSADTLIIPN